ncbi:MAG: hypothetical protein KH377_11125, partial [[Eubacterium] siraeum]|nr:hypothetical protein [[Eubacterium] siraeum]
GVFGKDAEIRTRRALHEAKPSECPKGDRDNKSEFYQIQDFSQNNNAHLSVGVSYLIISN